MRTPISIFILALTLASPAAQSYQFDDLDEIDRAERESSGGDEDIRLEVPKADLKALGEVRKSKDEDAVVQAASKILGRDQHNLFALNSLGVFYYQKGKLGLAQMFFDRALEKHKNSPAIHNNLGIIYLSQNNQRKAISAFKRAREIDSNYQVAAANLGAIFLEYHDYESAVSTLADGFRAVRSGLKKGDPQAIEVANNYAVALTKVGKHSRAEDIFEGILDRNKRNPNVLFNYAKLLIENKRKTKDGLKLISRIKFVSDDKELLEKADKLEQKALAQAKK